MRHPEHPLIDFLFCFLAALMVLSLLALGIVVMLAFTIVDGASRIVGRLRAKRGR